MADYTSAEIQAAVEKIVTSSIRRPYGSLGNRDAQTTFNDLQDAAAGLFILRANSPFYVVFLGAQRLAGLISAEAEIAQSLIEAIENANRYVTEIDNLAPLNNARAALDALSNAAGNRSVLFQSIEDVPAYQRYNQNIDRFLTESSKNSRSRGKIVPTPQESRAALAGLVRSLASQHAVIVDRAGLLTDAIDDYDSLHLPSVVASSVISKARAVLSDHIDELTELSPKDRLGRIRAVTLDLLAGRAAVAGLGSLRATTTFALIEGQGAPYADESHPATPAALSSVLGPYPIWSAKNTLDLVLDSGFTCSVPVPGSYLARFDSNVPEPYIVVSGASDALAIATETASGTLTALIPLTPGTRSAAQVVADINGGLALGMPIIAEVALQTLRFIGVVDINALSPTAAEFVLTTGTWAALGTRENDIVRVTDLTSASFGAEYRVDPGGVSGDTLTCTLESGPAPANESLIQVEVGLARTVRIRIKDGEELSSLNDRTAIIFPIREDNLALIGQPTAETPVPQSLGFVLGAQTRCRATTASQIAQDVPRSSVTQLSGIARLDAEAEFEATIYEGQGRTDPDHPNKLIASKLWTRAQAPAGQIGLIFSMDELGLNEIVSPGDFIVIRETAVSVDQGVVGTITAVTESTITADMSQAVSGGADLGIEVGPDLSLASEYLEAVITNSESQNGSYLMEARGQGSIPFEFTMEGQVPFHRGLGGQPAFFTLALGNSRVIFKSTKTDLSTKIELLAGGSNSAAARFANSLPAEAVGSTTFFQLPENPRTLQVGDSLELYASNYAVVSSSFELVGLELDDLLIELGQGLSTDQAPIQMSLSAQVPFARIRLSKKNNFALFEASLKSWLELYPNTAAWFDELTRLLNPLIINENPTAAAVNSAKLHVQQMLAVLTRAGALAASANPDEALESILGSYSVAPVEEVDVLVDTYLARGAVRGIDLLLQGRFNDFFGLSPEAMSYDGAAREALRDVQRLDLPVRKTGRTQNLDRQTVAEWEDPDFEFDQSDVEDAEDIEIPGEFTEITPPGR